MKKIFICVLVLFLVGCFNQNKATLRFTTPKQELREIGEISDVSKLYSVFPRIYYIKNNEEVRLEVAIREELITVDDIVAKMELKSLLNDGGTRIFKYDSGNFANVEFYLMRCLGYNGNRDIIILDEDSLTNPTGNLINHCLR